MNRRYRQAVAVLGTAAVVTLLWPGPSSADDGGPNTDLGGFSAGVTASPVRIQVFDQGIPGVPDPTVAQLDMGIGYSHSEGSIGRMASTSSYFWPGDAIGNGLGQFVPGQNYTVRSDAAYPATPATPAADNVQITDGNGMQTVADANSTTASCTGLGITGTNLLSGLGTGLGQLSGQTPAPAPVPAPNPLAALVSLKNVTSTTGVKLGQNAVTASAGAAVSSADILGGLIQVQGFAVSSTSTSDGTKATVDGRATIGGLTVLGHTIAVDAKGVDLAGTAIPLPQLPSLLAPLGLNIQWLQSTRNLTQDAGSAAATFSASGMGITVDTNVLWNALQAGTLLAPLAQVLTTIPTLGGILAGLVSYAPKIVIDLGSVRSSLTASPAFDFGSGAATDGASGAGGALAGAASGAGFGVGSSGGGAAVSAGDAGGTGAAPRPATTLGLRSASVNLPPLGTVPRLLLLGGLLLAAVLGWLLRLAAMSVFGGAGTCAMGLATGVPDLRKGTP